MEVFIGVVTFNRSNLLKRCIEKIQQQSHSNWTCYIIDNASTDDTKQVVSDVKNSRFKYIRNEKNLGGAGGFSIATRLFLKSRADAILLLDDDCTPTPSMLEKLIEKMHINELDLANALVVDELNSDDLAFAVRIAPSESSTEKFVSRTHDVIDASQSGILFGSAGLFNGSLFSRNLVERIGHVDERMFIWGDEIDYLWRAINTGAKIGIVCDAIMGHPRSQFVKCSVPLFGDLWLPPDSRAHIVFRNQGKLDYRKGIRLKFVPKIFKLLLIYLLIGRPRTGLISVIYMLDGAMNLYWLAPEGNSARTSVENEINRYLNTLEVE